MATVEKRGKSYKIVVSLGYDLNGNQIRHRTTWTPAPGMTPRQEAKELERQKVLFEERCRTGQVINSNIPFAEFAEVWFEKYGKEHLKKSTYRRYLETMGRINAAIGHIRLDRLKPIHIITFYENLAEAGVREDMRYRACINLKELLKEKKITQEQLREKTGLSISTIRKASHGNPIARKSAIQISAALDRPTAKLFEAVGEDTLSGSTILYHHHVISSILSTAVQWQVVSANPCDRVKPPKANAVDPRYLDEHEARLMLDLLENEPIKYRTAVQVILFMGYRRGELCGLEWKDIDFEQSLIRVTRSSLYIPEEGIFEDSPKNPNSIRSTKAPEIVMDILRAYRKWQTEERLKVGDQWHETQRIFTAWDGRPMHPDSLTGWFHNFVERNSLPPISIHSLRHTNATLLIAKHTPITTVARRLGHANPSTTTKIYIHAIQSAEEEAVVTLQNILAAPKDNRKKPV